LSFLGECRVREISEKKSDYQKMASGVTHNVENC